MVFYFSDVQKKDVRDGFKHRFTELAELYKDEGDKKLLNKLFRKIQKLEITILEEKKLEEEKKIKKEEEKTATKPLSIEDFNKEFQELKELKQEKEELEKEQIAAWRLFAFSLDLAISIVIANKDKKSLSEETKKEISILTDSLKFAKLVVNKKNQLTEDDLQKGIAIARQINEIKIAPALEDEKKYARKQKWLNFGIAFGAILFIAAIIVLTTTLSLGSGTGVVVGLALYFALALPGAFTGIFSGLGKMSIHDKQEEITWLPRKLHGFYESTVKHGKDKKVIPKEELNPSPPGNKKK